MATLALWMDFWGWDGSGPISVSSQFVMSPIVTGAARGRSGPENTYQMLPDDYWEQREATITGKDIPKADPSVPAPDKADAAPPPAPKQDEARAGLLDQMRNASSLDELKSISAQLSA